MAEQEIIVFHIGSKPYGLEVNSVYQIIEGNRAITSLPGAADYLAGIISFEGEILAVVSANKFFANQDLSAQASSSKIVVVQNESLRLGLLVAGKVEFIDNPALVKDLKMVEIEKIVFSRAYDKERT